jgi:hypothetical protein
MQAVQTRDESNVSRGYLPSLCCRRFLTVAFSCGPFLCRKILLCKNRLNIYLPSIAAIVEIAFASSRLFTN